MDWIGRFGPWLSPATSRELLFARGIDGKGSRNAALLDLALGSERVRFERHTNTVMTGALSPDGTLAATAGGNDNEIHLWKTVYATPLHRLVGRGRGAFSAGWSPDGQAIAWGNSNEGSTLDAVGPLERAFRTADLELFSAPSANFLRSRTASDSTTLGRSGVNAVVLRRGEATVATIKTVDTREIIKCFTLLTGHYAAVGTNFGLLLADTRSGDQVRKFQGHTGDVWAVATSPDGRFLLSASGDQTIRCLGPGP